MTAELSNPKNIYPQQHGVARLGDEQEQRVWKFVEAVVLCTRLWRDEKNEVRMELLHHFDDGVDAGQTLEQLFNNFGSPLSVARMIRAAKMRNRPWTWQVRRRAFQACLASLGLMLVGVLILEARLHLLRSGPRTDHVGQFDLVTQRVPIEDRAWPEYRQGLMLLDRTQFVRTHDKPELPLWGTPYDSHWDQLVEYLNASTRSLDLFVQASQHSQLGYVYRDTANDPWLKILGNGPSNKIFPANSPRELILLPHIQDLGHVRSLLYSAAILALENQDLPGFQRYWQAESRLGAQVLTDSDLLVVQSMGRASAHRAMALLRYLVLEHAELMSDEQLAKCRRDLDTIRWKTASTSVALRPMYEDMLQTVYTAESDGGGRLTSQGCRALRRHLTVASTDSLKWAPISAERDLAGATSIDDVEQQLGGAQAVQLELSAVRWSATLASRRELRLELERLMALLQRELDKPLATSSDDFAGTEYLSELQRIAMNSSRARRYWPALLIMPTRDYTYYFAERGQELCMMSRDGTLATIALEQYRRRTGNWPDKLEQLVPTDLPSVPRDIFSGQPLIYRVVADRPLIYSVWMDRDDDGGRPTPTDRTGVDVPDGDFRLVPVD